MTHHALRLSYSQSGWICSQCRHGLARRARLETKGQTRRQLSTNARRSSEHATLNVSEQRRQGGISADVLEGRIEEDRSSRSGITHQKNSLLFTEAQDADRSAVSITGSTQRANAHKIPGFTKSERFGPHDSILRLKREPVLPAGPARTRFAPSPTGYLHIGGLRTALFSYLLAKRTKGQFLLRIEDTDQKRLIPDAEQRLCDELRWAGLDWDEGPDIGGQHGPYRQSQRNDIYREHARKLLDEGPAYRCFCTPQTAEEPKAAYVSSGCYQNCSALSQDEALDKAEAKKLPFTVRLRQPSDAHKRDYPDLVYGNIKRLKRSPSGPTTASEDNTAIDASDTILVKSTGTPTYHFANVVDDHLMGITHVIRGSEWAASTPLHHDIYTAFNWIPPQFAHVGLLVDQNKAKLSKRNADLALDVASMRDRHGILATPLVNFLALLGWSNPTDNDVNSLQELIEIFDLKFTKGNTMVRMEKLWFLQKSHVAQLCNNSLVSRHRSADDHALVAIKDIVDGFVAEARETYPRLLANSELAGSTSDRNSALYSYCASILYADSQNYKNANGFTHRNRYFFAFERSEVPPAQRYYNKAQTVTETQLCHILERIFALEWILPGRETTTPPGDIQHHGDSLDDMLSNCLARGSWRCALDNSSFFPLVSPNEKMPERGIFHPDPVGATSNLHPTDTHGVQTSVQNIAREILPCEPSSSDITAQKSESSSGNFERSEGLSSDQELLVQRYKAINGALMRYLREKLSYGLPGPHITTVMAILGRDECARRLGFSPHEGDGGSWTVSLDVREQGSGERFADQRTME